MGMERCSSMSWCGTGQVPGHPQGQWGHRRGDRGRKVRGFPVQLHFSLSLERRVGGNAESSVKQDTKNTQGQKTRRGGDKDKMLEVAPASTKEPLLDPPRGCHQGCHRPSCVTSGGLGDRGDSNDFVCTGGSLVPALVTKDRACSGGWWQ